MLKKYSLLVVFLLLSGSCLAQWPFKKDEEGKDQKDKKEKLKVYQSSRGYVIGYERGRSDMIQLGYQYNWKKIRLKQPVIRAVEGYAAISPFTGVYGLQGGYWQRHGRLKLTYGGRVGAFTNFDASTLSIGPALGFRILGFHGQGGFNLLSNPEVQANRLYASINFFIPRHSRMYSKKGDKERTLFKY
jgi:hypothetical protein